MSTLFSCNKKCRFKYANNTCAFFTQPQESFDAPCIKRPKQPEGLCLMWYKCETCGHKERLWNSRPRVTPFIICCSKCDGDMQHVEWNRDEYAPDYQPKNGERIFVDCAYETFRDAMNGRIEQYWDHPEYPMSKHFESKGEALKALVKEWKFGDPHVITV